MAKGNSNKLYVNKAYLPRLYVSVDKPKEDLNKSQNKIELPKLYLSLLTRKSK